MTSDESSTRKDPSVGTTEPSVGTHPSEATTLTGEVTSEDTGGPRGGKAAHRRRLQWTRDLHARFLAAVTVLGDKARPKDIMYIMNVDQLSRANVASHLQQYRKASKDSSGDVLTGLGFPRLSHAPSYQHQHPSHSHHASAGHPGMPMAGAVGPAVGAPMWGGAAGSWVAGATPQGNEGVRDRSSSAGALGQPAGYDYVNVAGSLDDRLRVAAALSSVPIHYQYPQGDSRAQWPTQGAVGGAGAPFAPGSGGPMHIGGNVPSMSMGYTGQGAMGSLGPIGPATRYPPAYPPYPHHHTMYTGDRMVGESVSGEGASTTPSTVHLNSQYNPALGASGNGAGSGNASDQVFTVGHVRPRESMSHAASVQGSGSSREHDGSSASNASQRPDAKRHRVSDSSPYAGYKQSMQQQQQQQQQQPWQQQPGAGGGGGGWTPQQQQQQQQPPLTASSQASSSVGDGGGAVPPAGGYGYAYHRTQRSHNHRTMPPPPG